MLTRLLIAALVLPAFAGCLEGAPVESAALGVDAPTAVSFDGAAWAGALAWTGGELEAADRYDPPMGIGLACIVASCWRELACEPGSCERMSFQVAGGGEVQVRAQSVRNYTVGPFVRVFDASGALVAEAQMTDWLGIAVIPDAAPGEFVAEVIALWGQGAYEAAVVVSQGRGADDGPARELLPNLVTIRPSDLRVTRPDQDILGTVVGTFSTGCSVDEALEQMARRCLRFSNGVANVGEGPLEVRLEPTDAVTAFAGQGRFTQIITLSDGSTREEIVGPATYHASHRHYHYAGLATYELYAYDAASNARGEKVGEGRKAGFCFYDTAMVDLTRADVGPQGYDGRGCFGSPMDGAWYTGVSAGFTDFYGWYLPDQYIEISGIADGVYELVTSADGTGSLVESDTSDNAATAIFRLTGDDVEVLWTTGA